MGMFDIQFTKEIKSKEEKDGLFQFIKTELQKNKEYENTIEKNTLTINKCHVNTLTKYNLNIELQANKKAGEIIVNGELLDTLILAILIILAILFTYGIGVAVVVGFVYYQKIKATKYLKSLIDSYKHNI